MLYLDIFGLKRHPIQLLEFSKTSPAPPSSAPPSEKWENQFGNLIFTVFRLGPRPKLSSQVSEEILLRNMSLII